MRAINTRFLLVSAGTVVLLGIGANLLHGIQLRRSAGILLQQGEQKIKIGQPGQAVGYLSRYTSLAPHNAEAQILLADTLAQTGNRSAAIKWYENALLRDAGLHEGRRRLVELSIAGQRFSAAKEHLSNFLLPYTPNDARVYYLLGVCHEGLGEYAPAIQRFRDAIERDPALVEAYTQLATIVREQRKNAEEADAVMDQLVERNPENASAYIARANYRTKFRTAGALDDLRMAVRIAPEDLDILFRAAMTTLDLPVASDERESMLNESEGYLQKGLSLEPRYPGWYLGLAQVDRIRGDLDKALSHLEHGLSAHPNEGDLQWNMADMLIQKERFDAGLGIVARLKDRGYPNVPLEYLVALADARRMKFVDAAERWQKIRAQMEPWPDLARQTEYWLGLCYERLGEYGLQLTAFRNAVKIDPAWVPARQWLANALARTGRVDEAITEYEELTKLTGVPSTVFRELGRLLVLRELQQRSDARNWQRVVGFLDQASRLDPNGDEYTILRAEVQAAQRDLTSARATLEAGIQSRPDSLATRLALAALEQSADRWDIADKLIAESQEKFGDSADLRVARLRFLIQRHGIDAYKELQALEQRPLQATIEQTQRWKSSLAAAYYTLGKFGDAGRLWQQTVEVEPDNILLRMFLFDLALADADDSRMTQLLAEIRRIERSEERPLWRYGEATRLVVKARNGDTSVLPQAERLLEEVRAARQMWSRIPLLQAEISEIRGEHDKVVEQYLTAVELGERSPTIIRRVVELLYRQRRYTDADNILRRFEATQLPITGELGRLAADVSFRVQDFSRAMQIAVQVIGKSESYDDLVWMGQLHSVMHQPQVAEEKLKAAISKQPNSPEGWIALVQHYMRTDSPQKARVATSALTKSVDEKSVSFVQAICLEALGDIDAARKQFNKATQRDDADAIVLRVTANFFLSQGSPVQGERLLRRLVAHSQANESDLMWARRNLAAVWAAIGNNEDKQKGLVLIAENLKINASSSDDRRAKAVCLQAIGGTNNIETALTLVQGIISSRHSAASDYLLAYQLCAKLNRTAEARRYLEQHTFENSKEPENLVRYIRFVLDKNEFHEASLWIRQLQELCRDGFSSSAQKTLAEKERNKFHRFFVISTALEANLLMKQEGSKAAILRISNRIGHDNAATGAALSSLEAAEILERFAGQADSFPNSSAADLYSAAETILRDAAKKSTRDAVPLIAFLARRNRLPEALSTWKDRIDTSAADEYAIAAAALAAHPRLSSADLVDLTTRVKTLSEDHPTKAVLAGLGQLYTFRGQHAEAIAVYRKMLAQQPADVVTMNNLACYLALGGGNKEEALNLINNAISIEGPVASLLDSRGIILLEMGRPQEALRDIEQALQMALNSTTLLHLAAAKSRLKQVEESEKAMAQAHELGLDVTKLHPLERARYSELLRQAAL